MYDFIHQTALMLRMRMAQDSDPVPDADLRRLEQGPQDAAADKSHHALPADAQLEQRPGRDDVTAAGEEPELAKLRDERLDVGIDEFRFFLQHEFDII